jgi:hypothetical protein
MAVVDVIYDDDNLTIFGPPDQIELSVDIGSQGNSGTIQIGTVATVAAGTPAAVSNVGSLSNAILNFTIPQGQTGSQGQQGIPGDTVPISTEQVQDAAVPLFNHEYHTGFTVTYDDANNRLLFASDTVLTTEQVQDTIATLFAAGTHTGASVVYNDAGNALSIAVTGIDYNNVSVTTYANEGALPSASSNTGKWAYVSGTGSMYYSHNNAWVKIINYTQEQIQDEIASIFGGSHNGITASYNDSTGQITLTNTGLFSIFGQANQISTIISENSASISLPSDLITPGDITVLGSASVIGNMTIDGNLLVSGSAFTVNTTELLIEDNFLTLNYLATGAPSVSAGLEIERGSSNNVSITWNEGSDKWQFTNDGVTYEDLGASSASVNQKASNFYDVVRDYGVSAGEGDSATKIQNALNAARDAGGGTVYIPTGTYNLGSRLEIYTGTTLLLSQKTVMFRNHNSNMIINGAGGASYSGYAGQTDIKIIGGIWECRGTAFPSTPAMGISIGHGSNIIIQDLTVSNVGGYHAIEINSSKNVRISNCRFVGYKDTGSRAYSEAVQIDLAKSSGVFGAFGSYDNTPSTDVVVENCYFGPSGTAGTTSWPTGVGSHSYTSGYKHTNVKIIGNTFDSMTEYAIRLDVAYDDTIISNNIIKNCYAGIGAGFDQADRITSAQQCKNLIITGNQVEGAGSTSGHMGIYVVNYDGVTVNDNHVKNFGVDGIAFTTVVDGTINGNRLENIGNDGIDIRTNSSSLMVSNNVIKDVSQATNNTHRFIYVSDSTINTSIIANRGFKENSNVALYGIQITNTCSGMRAFGNFVGVAATTAYQDNSSASTTTTNG